MGYGESSSQRCWLRHPANARSIQCRHWEIPNEATSESIRFAYQGIVPRQKSVAYFVSGMSEVRKRRGKQFRHHRWGLILFLFNPKAGFIWTNQFDRVWRCWMSPFQPVIGSNNRNWIHIFWAGECEVCNALVICTKKCFSIWIM